MTTDIKLPFLEGDLVVFKPITGDECYEWNVPEYGTKGVVTRCVVNTALLTLGIIGFLVYVNFDGETIVIYDEDLKLCEK